MKVGITGHFSGLGKELYPRFDSMGFDLKNGYDIANPEPILKELVKCNVFINNAYDGPHQAYLFKEIENIWKGTNNHIVNISSMAVSLNKTTQYALNKKLLEEVSRSSSCRVSLIRPAMFDTPMVAFDTHSKKMPVKDVADAIEFVINSPINIRLMEITYG